MKTKQKTIKRTNEICTDPWEPVHYQVYILAVFLYPNYADLHFLHRAVPIHRLIHCPEMPGLVYSAFGFGFVFALAPIHLRIPFLFLLLPSILSLKYICILMCKQIYSIFVYTHRAAAQPLIQLVTKYRYAHDHINIDLLICNYT